MVAIIDVATAQLPDGTAQVLAVAQNTAVYSCWKTSAHPGALWSGWVPFPGLAKKIVSATVAPGVPQLWGIGVDDKLYTCWKTSTAPGATWTGWTPHPAPFGDVLDIATAQLPDGTVQVFATQSDHTVHTCWKTSPQPAAPWSGWVPFPGLAKKIVSATVAPGVPQLWGIGVDDQLYTCWKVSTAVGATWTSWEALPPRPFQPATYRCTLVSMKIYTTRSRHEDSDRAVVSVAVGSGTPQTATMDLGDHNDGTFAIGLSCPPVKVTDPTTGLAFNYIIVNSGHGDWATVNAALVKGGAALALAGAEAATAAAGTAVGATIGTTALPVIGTVIGALAGWLAAKFTGLLTADCDGPVAAEQPVFKGLELWRQTEGPDATLTRTTYHPGVDSAAGCGSNSHYDVTWSITRI